jgi:hypothetical protein
MPKFEDIIAEWPKIKVAPRSFAIVTIVPTLILAGFFWFAINWSYSAMLSGRDGQIALLRDRVADYEQKLKGQNQAAGEIISLRDQLKDAKKQLGAIVNPPRDGNSVYQNGNRIGIIAGANVDSTKKIAKFYTLTVGGKLDKGTNVEFRNLILSYISADSVSQTHQGLIESTTYRNARFSIVGNRVN